MLDRAGYYASQHNKRSKKKETNKPSKKKKQLDSDREARHSRYHDAVMRGRNPKSFQHKDDPMWDSVYVDMLRFSRGTNRVEK